MVRRSIFAFFILIASNPLALAGEAVGVWLHEDGGSKIRFAPCGVNICGAIAWVKDPNGAGKVGQRVFFDMKPSGEDSWVGKAFDPTSGKEYSGKMTLAGDKLTTAGCVLGGLICKSIDWTRSQ
jgi:uncharacterized protein (DUF2147 family)